MADLLKPLDKKWKIYEKTNAWKNQQPLAAFSLTDTKVTPAAKSTPNPEDRGVARFAEKALLNQFAPPSAIIDERGEILYIHGRTGKYLEPSPGETRFNIHDMARKGLQANIAPAIQKAMNTRQPLVHRGIKVQTNGHAVMINLRVKPLQERRNARQTLLVSFEEDPRKPPAESQETDDHRERRSDPDVRNRELEQELEQTRENLQSTIEELETANEELKSTNEELQSTNEELQSTNEELETSKEGQQSLNEELVTVNAELQKKIEQLVQANSDMKNLLDSTSIPVLFLDNVLRIKRYTPQASRLVNLIESDIGRPVSDISTKLEAVDLRKLAAAVLKDLVYREREIHTSDGKWYTIRVSPYRTFDNVIDGVVITFFDITGIKESQARFSRLETILRDAKDGVIAWDFSGRIRNWNRGAESMYGYTEAQALTMNIMDLVPENKREETRKFIEELRQGIEIRSFRTQRKTAEGNIKDIWLTITRVPDQMRNDFIEVVTTERDLKWLEEETGVIRQGQNENP